VLAVWSLSHFSTKEDVPGLRVLCRSASLLISIIEQKPVAIVSCFECQLGAHGQEGESLNDGQLRLLIEGVAISVDADAERGVGREERRHALQWILLDRLNARIQSGAVSPALMNAPVTRGKSSRLTR
jgi:hypothetical protein